MKKSDINPMPQYYDRYINLVPDVELSQAFDDSLRQINDLDRKVFAELGDKTYAPGKWTLKDIIQHIADGERIMAYRALMFARDNGSRVEGFDQEVFAANADTSRRTTDDLLDEVIGVRRSTKTLFDSFTEQMLLAKGLSWEHEISVVALGFMMVGHQIHHLNVIAEKYLPLATST